MITKEDINELSESIEAYIRDGVTEIEGKMEQRHYNALTDLVFAFLTTFVKPR